MSLGEGGSWGVSLGEGASLFQTSVRTLIGVSSGL